MPFVNVKLMVEQLDDEQIDRLQQGFTELMETRLRKVGQLTAVAVERVPAGVWSIGASPVKTAAHVDAIVSAGTNDAAEKARFIDDAYALLRRVLGDSLEDVTYVVVHEVPKDSWGYGGKTQLARAAQASTV